ncbi:hypothetical protein R1sor_018738 [Riccia sorocarpa]|uniref:WD40 repeat-like protein n=1 Tax=Riccia sorocarpa TaxID=122646 RepID=A0ABD3IB27_9MARC
MDKFVVRTRVPSDLPQDNRSHTSLEPLENRASKPKRKESLLAAYEINGRVLPIFRPSLLKLTLNSYAEFGVIDNYRRYLRHDQPYSASAHVGEEFRRASSIPGGVSALDFDSKGIYMAAISSMYLLTIYEFETLYCHAEKGSNDNSRFRDGNAIPIIFQTRERPLEAVKWNPSNEDEVACVAAGSKKIYFYDISRVSLSPSAVLKVKAPHGWGQIGESLGFYDLAFFNDGSSRVLACGRDNHVHIWDRRVSTSASTAHAAPGAGGALNSVDLSKDKQIVYSGSEGGYIYSWDLRGGRQEAAFVTSSKGYTQPLAAVKIETMLRSIPSLSAQTEISTSAVHSVSLNPACGEQLAFHLNSGWSGVLDTFTLNATHLHCPPPPWIERAQDQVDLFGASYPSPAGDLLLKRVVRRRRPAWLHSWPVYAVGSGSENKVHMLDFTPGSKSRHSLEHQRSNVSEDWQVELRTSDAVLAVAAHPLNDTLVAGCESGKLLLIGQKSASISGQETD